MRLPVEIAGVVLILHVAKGFLSCMFLSAEASVNSVASGKTTTLGHA